MTLQLKENTSLKSLQIRVGSVFRMVCYPKDGVTPKKKNEKSRTKYFVITGTDNTGNFIGASLINTNININLACKIADYQLCIYPDRYDFLDNQHRYVDCYKILIFENKHVLQDADYIGFLEEEDVMKVRDLIKSSPLTTKFIIDKFGL